MKLLIAKAGLDGHDRGAIAVTKALCAAGFDASFSGIRRTPEEIAAMAVERQVDCVGLSSLAGAHLTVFPKVLDALRAAGWSGRLVIAGGIIPDEDAETLRKLGIAAVFGPNRPLQALVDFLRNAALRGTEGENEVV